MDTVLCAGRRQQPIAIFGHGPSSITCQSLEPQSRSNVHHSKEQLRVRSSGYLRDRELEPLSKASSRRKSLTQIGDPISSAHTQLKARAPTKSDQC
jgi:hypothetical protein